MIIGTSDRMTDIVATQLGLQTPQERIYIEDVTTEEERQIAYHFRNDEGEHVIPAPVGQLRRDFAGYFMDPIKKFIDKARGNAVEENSNDEEAGNDDRTVVRPTFSSLGSYSISDEAILDLIKIVLKDVPGFAEVTSFKTEKQTFGVMISLDLALYYGYDAQKVLVKAQQRVGSAVEEFTSITMNSVNVRASRLIHMPRNKDSEDS